ncbi:Uncharacterised protein [Mycobacterium tuberculosis]|nr:Uncharacterised protein [Mycobacterium tuberculosis]CKS11178.1 Uncharacterised protein [Mycobacterium tuberculosis]CNL55531.1 Uncharacterised protein [Mycobacterium tuberculosis]CNL81836.1 Uncharacterised protein [Mycobacterium tuberculosis]CNL82951.1 Uncharacterised protein [Mycobacterium tuberculosis]
MVTGPSTLNTFGACLPAATARRPLMASSWSWANTTARERPWLRRDNDLPIDSSEEAWPSGLCIQSANSAAAAFLRDVRNADTANGTNGAVTSWAASSSNAASLSRSASSVTPGSSGSGSSATAESVMMLPNSSNRSAWPANVGASAGSAAALGSGSGSGSFSTTSRGRTSRTTTCALAPPKPKLDTPASA